MSTLHTSSEADPPQNQQAPSTKADNKSFPPTFFPQQLDDLLKCVRPPPIIEEDENQTKIIENLCERFAGEEPTQYAQEILKRVVFDPARMPDDPEHKTQAIDMYLQITGRGEQLRRQLAAQLEARSQRPVNLLSAEVTELMLQTAEREAIEYWKICNAKEIGKIVLSEATQYMLFANMTRKEGPIPYPIDTKYKKITDGIPTRMIEPWDPQNNAASQNWVRLARKGDQKAQTLVAEMTLKEKWNKLSPDKQKEVLQFAATRCLQRLAALGEQLLRDEDPMGLVCLMLAGENQFTQERLQLIKQLISKKPDTVPLLERLEEIKKMPPNQPVNLTLTDNFIVTTVKINNRFEILNVYFNPPGMRRPPVRFDNQFEGSALSVIKQMMGITPMREELSKTF